MSNETFLTVNVWGAAITPLLVSSYMRSIGAVEPATHPILRTLRIALTWPLGLALVVLGMLTQLISGL